MTATTPTEVSTEDMPLNVAYGTGKKRKLVYLRATTGVDHTIALATYVDDIADIEGIVSATDDGAEAGTMPTWSTTTVTTKVAGVGEMCFIVTMT